MKKFLSILSLTIIITSLLPLYAAADSAVSVYPQLRIMYGEGLEDYQQLNAGLTLVPSGDDQLVLDYIPAHLSDAFSYGINGTGILIPFAYAESNAELPDKTYINNFSVQIWLRDTGSYTPDAMLAYPISAPLNNVYYSYSYDSGSPGEFYEMTYDYSNGLDEVHFSGSHCDVYYSVNYTPRNSNGEYVTEDYYGVLNIDVTTSFYTGGGLPEMVFLNIDFTNLFAPGFEYRIQINPAKTVELTNTNIDDVNTQLSEIQRLLNKLNSSLGSLGDSFVPDTAVGDRQWQTLGDVLADIYITNSSQSDIVESGLAALEQKSEEIRSKIDDLNENMTDYVEQADKNTKDSFVKEATDGLNENFDKIMESVDIINTDAIESSMNLLYSSIDSDSMHPVLTVGAFTVPVLGDSYTLWESFDIDIVDLSQKMGFDKYLFWFRFTFYIAVAFFLYNRVSRIINIIILDDVREEASQARAEARERRKG